MVDDTRSTEPDPDRAVSSRIVERVADVKGLEPVDLTPLCEHLDPDALDRLFRTTGRSRSDIRVEFTIADCEVVVSGGETVEVTVSTADPESPTRCDTS